MNQDFWNKARSQQQDFAQRLTQIQGIPAFSAFGQFLLNYLQGDPQAQQLINDTIAKSRYLNILQSLSQPAMPTAPQVAPILAPVENQPTFEPMLDPSTQMPLQAVSRYQPINFSSRAIPTRQSQFIAPVRNVPNALGHSRYF